VAERYTRYSPGAATGNRKQVEVDVPSLIN